jgi:hypothetical protein
MTETFLFSENPQVLAQIRRKSSYKLQYDFTVDRRTVSGAVRVSQKNFNYFINIPAALEIEVYNKKEDGSYYQTNQRWRWLAEWLPAKIFIVYPFHRPYPTYLRENWRDMLNPARYDMELHDRRLELFYPIWKKAK